MVDSLTNRESWFLDRMHCSSSELGRLREVDPTGKAWAWALKGLRDGWLAVIEANDFQEALAKFNSLRQSPKFKETFPTDLTRYPDFSALQEALRKGEELKSNKQKARQYEGAVLLGETGNWTMYRVEGEANFKALQALSSGTAWCTAQDDTARSYLRRNPIYNIRYSDIPVCQIDMHSGQFHDTNNNMIPVQGRILLDPELGSFILNNADKDLVSFLGRIKLLVMQSAAGPGVRYLNPTNRFEPQEEADWLSEAPNYAAMRYAAKFITKPDPKLERGMAEGCVPPAIVEYYSCNVRTSPWNMDDAYEAAACRVLQNRSASYVKYLSKFFDLSTHVFHNDRELEIWLGTNPQILNQNVLDLVEKALPNDSRNLSSIKVAYYRRMAKKHPLNYYRMLLQNGSFGDLRRLFHVEPAQELPALEEEFIYEMTFSTLHRVDRYNGSWHFLNSSLFYHNPVVNHFCETLLKNSNYRHTRKEEFFQIVKRSMESDNYKTSMEGALLKAFKNNHDDYIADVLVSSPNVNFEVLDPIMEATMVDNPHSSECVTRYLVRRTDANYNRDWSVKALTNMSRYNYNAWLEYSKTAEIPEGTKFLMALQTGDHKSILRKILDIKTLEECQITLEDLAKNLFSNISRPERMHGNALMVAGVLHRKFGWEIPKPSPNAEPDQLVHYYYYSGQKDLFLTEASLEMIKLWRPQDIANFMIHMKGEWKGTEMARRISRYKKDIVSTFPQMEAEEKAFWHYVATGEKTALKSRSSQYMSMLRELKAYDPNAGKPVEAPIQPVEAPEWRLNDNGDAYRVMIDNAAVQPGDVVQIGGMEARIQAGIDGQVLQIVHAAGQVANVQVEWANIGAAFVDAAAHIGAVHDVIMNGNQ